MFRRRFTRTREQLCDERTWYGSPYFNEFRRPLRQDDQLYSHLPLPRLGCASAISFTRVLGHRPFTDAHRRMVHLFHEELGRLWETPALSSSRDGRPPPHLSPRLKQTLSALAAGDSEKQVAARLCLSRHTVHDYVKELHRRYGASSLNELLARAHSPERFRPSLRWSRTE